MQTLAETLQKIGLWNQHRTSKNQHGTITEPHKALQNEYRNIMEPHNAFIIIPLWSHHRTTKSVMEPPNNLKKLHRTSTELVQNLTMPHRTFKPTDPAWKNHWTSQTSTKPHNGSQNNCQTQKPSWIHCRTPEMKPSQTSRNPHGPLPCLCNTIAEPQKFLMNLTWNHNIIS